MTYASLALLQDRYGDRMLIDLTDRAKIATGVIDTDVVDRALGDADAVIDGYIGTKYALPLATTPALITDLSQAIAIYKLHRNTVSEKIEKEHAAAIKSLRDISTGVMRLDVAGVAPTSSGSGGVRISDCDRPMTNDSMKGYI